MEYVVNSTVFPSLRSDQHRQRARTASAAAVRPSAEQSQRLHGVWIISAHFPFINERQSFGHWSDGVGFRQDISPPAAGSELAADRGPCFEGPGPCLLPSAIVQGGHDYARMDQKRDQCAMPFDSFVGPLRAESPLRRFHPVRTRANEPFGRRLRLEQGMVRIYRYIMYYLFMGCCRCRRCDFKNPFADIVELKRVDPRASKAFQREDKPASGVRLAFMFTVYTDGAYMRRLMKRLYSPDHYYLIHVDAAGASAEFTVSSSI